MHLLSLKREREKGGGRAAERSESTGKSRGERNLEGRGGFGLKCFS